jgi:hypothetical protein
MLGSLHTLQPTGILLVGVVLLFWFWLLGYLARLRQRETRSRWASTLRDFLSLLCLLALIAAFRVRGFPLPAALLIAGTLGVMLDLSRHAANVPARRLALGCTFVAGMMAALFPEGLLGASNQFVSWLMTD